MLPGLCFGEEAKARNLVFFHVKWPHPPMKGTWEDRLWESKFYIPFQPEKRGKTEILHLQPSYGICWNHKIETQQYGL